MVGLPEGFAWGFALNEGRPLNLDAKKNGDEWIEFVFRRLTETCASTGYSMSAHNGWPGGYIYRSGSSRLSTALWVIFPADKGPICIVLGTEVPEDVQIEPWRDAVMHALGQIGATEKFGWWAVIGPDPDSMHGSLVGVRLSSSTEIGGMLLEPSPKMYVEANLSRFELFSMQINITGLVKVRGTSSGYSWDVAQEDASRRMRLLCALLSVATGVCWTQRAHVNPLLKVNADGKAEPASGDDIRLPERQSWVRDDLLSGMGEYQINELSLPDWLSLRWNEVLLDKDLQDALVNFHEGLTLERFHPSYAALAFVAVIEAIGNKGIKKLPRCERCKLYTGSGKRFRAALARVIPPEEAEYFGRQFYDRRSRTAHQGVLHGTEPLFGAQTRWGGITHDPFREFEGLLRKLSSAARRLLLLEAGPVDAPTAS